MPERRGQQRVQVLTARRSRARLLLLLLTLLALAVGCSTKRNNTRRQGELKEHLTECAEGYWRYVRWGQLEKAMEFVEEGPERTELWDYLMSRKGKVTLGEIDVYRIEVASDLKTGSVGVTYELVLPNAESVEKRQVKQTWYTRDGRWYLEIEPEELKRLE